MTDTTLSGKPQLRDELLEVFVGDRALVDASAELASLIVELYPYGAPSDPELQQDLAVTQGDHETLLRVDEANRWSRR